MCKKIIGVMMIVFLLSGMLTGCSSGQKLIDKITQISEEERSEKDWLKLAEAYWEMGQAEKARDTLWKAEEYLDIENLSTWDEMYLLPAPTADKEAGSYDGAVTITFPGDQYSHGDLYITVDRNEDVDILRESDQEGDDGLLIGTYGSEEQFSVCLYEPGEHTVRAFVAYDGYGYDVQSHVFEAVYTITGADFSSFQFSHAEGTYPAGTAISFKGMENGTVYYNLNGKDPLTISTSGVSLSENGTTFSGTSLPLHNGRTTVKARLMTNNGLISPLLTGEFKLQAIFESTSLRVGENAFVDFVVAGGGVYAYPKDGSPSTKIYSNSVNSLSVFAYEGKRKDAYTQSDVEKASMFGEAALRMNEDTDNTLLYVLPSSGNIKCISYADTQKTHESTRTNRILPTFFGNSSWRRYDGKVNATGIKEEQRIGTEAAASKAQMMTKNLAVWVTKETTTEPAGYSSSYIRGKWRKQMEYNYHYAYHVYGCNPDGSNERILWTQAEEEVKLDAMTDQWLFYHVGDKHMIYNLSTGEHKDNTLIPSNASLTGYSSSAVYYVLDGTLKRLPVDYSAI